MVTNGFDLRVTS